MFNHDGWLFGGGMWLMWIVFIVLLVLAIKYLVAAGRASHEDDSPITILKKRYARGEIDDEEFERRRKQLER